MVRIKERVKGLPKEQQRQQAIEELPEVNEGDLFSTIKEWESLYPHTYGDEILNDILERKSN